MELNSQRVRRLAPENDPLKEVLPMKGAYIE